MLVNTRDENTTLGDLFIQHTLLLVIGIFNANYMKMVGVRLA